MVNYIVHNILCCDAIYWGNLYPILLTHPVARALVRARFFRIVNTLSRYQAQIILPCLREGDVGRARLHIEALRPSPGVPMNTSASKLLALSLPRRPSLLQPFDLIREGHEGVGAIRLCQDHHAYVT